MLKGMHHALDHILIDATTWYGMVNYVKSLCYFEFFFFFFFES